MNISNYGLSLDKGQTCIMDNIKFGAGSPYTIEKTRGNASNALIENDNVKVTSLGLGDTYYKVRDKRGSVARFVVQTTLQFEMVMTANYFEFDGINNLSANVILKWGSKWEIVGSTNKTTERISVGHPINAEPGSEFDYDVLSMHTTNEGKGTDTITLKDKDGNIAVIRVRVR